MAEHTPQQFRMARAALALSVVDFAKLCDVSHFTVSRIEKAATMPDVRRSTVAKILDALKTEGIRLYGGEAEFAVFIKKPRGR